MNSSNTFSYLFLIVISFTLVIASCSDDTTSSIDHEEPVVPEATPYVVDNSVFEDAETEGETSAFQIAETLVNSASIIVLGISNSGNTYLNLVENQEPEFIDGLWVWEFTVEETGNSVTIRTTAEDQAGTTEWNIFFSGTIDEYEDLDEFRFANGVIGNDGLTGTWTYYSPENQQSPVYTYEWIAESETEYQINSTYSFEEEAELTYQKENDENLLEFNGFDNESLYVVYWNSDTGEGYFEDGGERNCWDQNYQNVDC